MRTLLCICSVLICGSVFAQPLPPGFKPVLQSPRAASSTIPNAVASVAPGPTNPPVVRIEVQRYTPQISRLMFWCITNAPTHWSLERSEDLQTWTAVERSVATNDWRPTVPMLRDNAKLITHLLVSPSLTHQFYRVKFLP